MQLLVFTRWTIPKVPFPNLRMYISAIYFVKFHIYFVDLSNNTNMWKKWQTICQRRFHKCLVALKRAVLSNVKIPWTTASAGSRWPWKGPFNKLVLRGTLISRIPNGNFKNYLWPWKGPFIKLCPCYARTAGKMTMRRPYLQLGHAHDSMPTHSTQMNGKTGFSASNLSPLRPPRSSLRRSPPRRPLPSNTLAAVAIDAEDLLVPLERRSTSYTFKKGFPSTEAQIKNVMRYILSRWD